MHSSQRADTMRCPGFPLAGAHSHSVQRRGDMLISDHRAAMLRITASASSGDAAAVFAALPGLRTRNWECWPPRLQWIVRRTSRAASSTSAMMSATRARRSCWRARMVTFGEFHAASRSAASPEKSSASATGSSARVTSSSPDSTPLDTTQRRFPALFQLCGDQSIIWVACGIAALSQRGFVAGLCWSSSSTARRRSFWLSMRIRSASSAASIASGSTARRSSRARAASTRVPPNVMQRD